MQLHELLDRGVTLLTASRRLAHHVRLSYAQRAQRSGLRAWRSPRVLPWSAWLRQQFLESRAKQTQSTPLRVLTSTQARVLWEDIVAGSRFGQTLLNPASAARIAQTSWRRLHDHLIPLEKLRAFDSPEPAALLEWSTQFERRCNVLRAIDEAQLSAWAARTQLLPTEPLAFSGFDVFPPALEQLIDRWRSAGLVLEMDEAAEPAAAALAPAIDAAAEIELAARWARSQVEVGRDGIGIIVADLQNRREDVQRVFQDVFAPSARRVGETAPTIPVVIAAPAPLASYPIVDAAMLVLELASSAASSMSAGRLLRSPFIAAAENERACRALADLRLRAEQRDRWDWFELERWAAVAACERLQLAARDVATLLRDAPAAAGAGQWSERFFAVLRAAGWPGERTLDSVEHQTLQKFQAALADFGALDAIAGRMNMRQAVHRLAALLRDTAFEPETVAGAVTVIDALTSAGMRFDALWITGLHAERLPSATAPDPLIPVELQRGAGMLEATPAGMLELAERQLARWRRAASEVVFSWPQHEGDAELALSPLVAALQPPMLQFSSASAPSLQRTLFAARPALESVEDARAPPLPSAAARGGARILELQSACPFRAQAELRLGAQPLPRVALGVEPLERGALLHRVLADVWGGLRTHRALAALDEEALTRRVLEAARRHAMQALRPTSRHRSRLAELEIDYVTRQVLRLLTLEKQRPPFTVRLAESTERRHIGGLEITLRPDRIDELENGGELLIDYKLGETHRTRDWLDEQPGRPRRPQLPLYGLARAEKLSALAYVVLAPGAVEYRGWSRSGTEGAGVPPYPSGVRIDLGDPADWEALLHHWSFTLTRLAEQFVAGDAVVDPLRGQCDTCDLSTLCRIHERAGPERSETNDE